MIIRAIPTATMVVIGADTEVTELEASAREGSSRQAIEFLYRVWLIFPFTVLFHGAIGKEWSFNSHNSSVICSENGKLEGNRFVEFARRNSKVKFASSRYPERTVDDAPLRGGSLHQQQQQEMLDHYYNYRGSEQQQQQRYPQGNLRMGSGGTLERNRHHSGTGGGVGGDSMASIDSYHPPPPLVPVTEQPKSGTGPSPHFQHHPFDRTAGFGPKTLESLAERVHPFYGMHGQPPSGSGPNAPGQMGRASTLGRTTRAGGASSSGPGSTMSLMRGNRLTRSGSDQRLPAVESGSEFYEYVMSNTSRSKSSASGTYGGASTPGRLDAASRLGLTHRRRTSIDYASDTEASVSRGYTRRGYTQHTEGASGGWKAPPPLLGLSATTPTSALQSSHLQGQPDSRSNSLPRGSRFRREVHFESASSGAPSRPAPPLQHHLDSLDDSDGAVSAPELSEKQKQLQRLSQQHQQLLYGRSILSGSTAPGGMPMMGGSGPGAGPTGNFTAAEYKAWMQRAPSTSAIYERLRQGREAIEAHRTAKLTFSAENLVEKSKQVRTPLGLAHLIHFQDSTGRITSSAERLNRAFRIVALKDGRMI